MGKHPTPIDWNEVEKLLQRQCSCDEIAGHFGLHRSNFYIAVQRKYGVNFTTYATPFYSKGKAALRAKQFDKAMQGNIQLLCKLGDVYLGQKESQQIIPNDKLIDEKLDSLHSHQVLSDANEQQTNSELPTGDSPS